MIKEAIGKLIWIWKQKVIWFPKLQENPREFVANAFREANVDFFFFFIFFSDFC
jgi:hypothetical protein